MRKSISVTLLLLVGAIGGASIALAKDAPPPVEWLKWATVSPGEGYEIVDMPMSLVQVYDVSLIKDPIAMTVNEAMKQVNNQCKEKGGDMVIGADFSYIYYPGGGQIMGSAAKIMAFGTCVKSG